MGHYDFAVSLKEQYKAIKGLPETEVAYSLQYIPWILKTTADTYKKHHKRYDFNELLSVAFTAAVEAEKKYDVTTNNKFTTYAQYHVEPALNEYVSNMSKTQLDLQKKIQNFINTYYETNKMYPAENIILKELKISEETFRNLVNTGVDLIYIEDNDDTLICNDTSAEQELVIEQYLKILEYIDVDNQGVLKMHLIDDLPFSIIAKLLNLTKEKAQRLFDKALVELRQEFNTRGIHKEDFL